MAPNSSEIIVRGLFSLAGIEVNGSSPWDIQVHDQRVYDRILRETTLGLGESYMDGWWDCEALDVFITKALTANLREKVKGNWKIMLHALQSRLFNLQSKARAFEVGKRHYDLGNDLYEAMLDSRLNYTCAYWKNATTLDEAQEAKLDLVCRKLDLQPGMRVLDIGCGWGGTARFAAERYEVEVVGITVSEEQVRFGKKLCRGLPVQIRLQDYRSLEGTFDRILSLGMFEHVGYKNYTNFQLFLSYFNQFFLLYLL